VISHPRLTREIMAPPDDHEADLPFTTKGQIELPKFVPAPVQRPPVDPIAAQVFGRPPGVLGAFADQPEEARRTWSVAPSPPEALAATFARPSGYMANKQDHGN